MGEVDYLSHCCGMMCMTPCASTLLNAAAGSSNPTVMEIVTPSGFSDLLGPANISLLCRQVSQHAEPTLHQQTPSSLPTPWQMQFLDI